jgi:FMN phosphatase YigB (HAD superfamily)
MITFIYFDVGGVLVFDFSKSNKFSEMLNEIGIKPEYIPDAIEAWDMFEEDFCTGKDTEIMKQMYTEKFGVHFSPDYTFIKDFADRFAINTSIRPIVEKVRSIGRIGLLTNMYTGMLSELMARGMVEKNIWDVINDSSVIGVAKPHRDIFVCATANADVKPEAILFVENTQRHIDAAKEYGWQTFLYDPVNYEQSNRKLLELIEAEISSNPSL